MKGNERKTKGNTKNEREGIKKGKMKRKGNENEGE
jgi:hypothetical protein